MDFYVGIDVSKFKHTVAIIDQNGEIMKEAVDILANCEFTTMDEYAKKANT